MPKPVELGSRIKLPSGKDVRITAPADARRPWQAVQAKGAWHVCRPEGQPHRGGPALYYGGNPVPLQLDEADAHTLAEVLNEVRPGRYPE